MSPIISRAGFSLGFGRRRGGAAAGIVPGDILEGGFFAGYISHTQNSVATHALIVGPIATCASGTQSGYSYPDATTYTWKTTDTATTGTTNTYDGAVNQAAMVTAGIALHPAAEFCENLTVGGYTDWYLPAYYELDIAYTNLKPTTDSNNTSYGINPFSVPAEASNRTAGTPARTSLADFQTGGAEAFIPVFHWASTQFSNPNAFCVRFSDGLIRSAGGTTKGSSESFRAFRKVAL